MKNKPRKIAILVLLAFYALTAKPNITFAQAAAAHSIAAPVILNRDHAPALLPPSVFFRGIHLPSTLLCCTDSDDQPVQLRTTGSIEHRFGSAMTAGVAAAKAGVRTGRAA